MDICMMYGYFLEYLGMNVRIRCAGFGRVASSNPT